MNHAALSAIHADAIRSISSAEETIRYAESAIARAKEARASAERVAAALEPMMRDAWSAEHPGK